MQFPLLEITLAKENDLRVELPEYVDESYIIS